MLECVCGWQSETDEQPGKCPNCGKSIPKQKQKKLSKSRKKSGRERKNRRRQRKKEQFLEAQKQAIQEQLASCDPVWGLGGEANDRQSNRIIKRFLKKRWDTDKTSSELIAQHEADRTPRDTALIVTHDLIQRPIADEKDAAIVNTAIRNLVTMEGQNQKDEISKEPEQHLHIHGEVEDNPYLKAPMERILEVKAALFRLEEESE